MRSPKPVVFLIAIPVLCLCLVAVYYLPPVNERLAWRVDNLRADIKYALNPPEEAVFVPQEQVAPIVEATMQALTPTATPTIVPTTTPTKPGPTDTPAPSPTPTYTPTPIPDFIRLEGFRHEYQQWNNCGPANLSMALSYWGWEGDQTDTAAYLKPNDRDKNVMPYEMADFVAETTDLSAVVRVGGDLDMIKRFVAAGFPVLIEKGFEGDRFDGWMGHYEVINGYDEAEAKFYVYDSYVGPDHDFPITYEEVNYHWQAFNYTYLIIYPPEREAEVMAILGPQSDEAYNYQYAADLASNEIYSLTGRSQYFAWYNRGSNLVRLQDYAGAALAFDEAFALYPQITQEQRPWRMFWYQTGPYFAYFYTGRYYDVINLATTTIDTANEPAIEESFYWRGMAHAALGDTASAIRDFRESLEWHPDFIPSLYQLELLDASP
jgi:tetratricopeptide (TPR) repeat protein